jgi:RND family efflux transporter MFP subunit
VALAGVPGLPSLPTRAAAPDGAAPPTVRGLLVPVRETVLSAEIPGRIDAVPVIDGQSVAAGDDIAVLDCRSHRLRRDRHAAEIRLAEQTLAVQRRLSGLNSGSALDAATARARLDIARVDAALTDVVMDRCVIAAPFGGRIETVHVNAHQYVTEGQPVAALYDDSALEVEMIVPSHWLGWLDVGAAFSIAVEELDRSFPGTVTRLGARIDPASQSLKIVGDLSPAPPAAAGLLPGMSGQVRFLGP